MKPESLESLLVDRALGALSPEVDELLAEHLTHHSAAAARSAALTDQVALARRAVAVTSLPRVAPPRWRPKSTLSFATARQGLPLAACLAVGLLAGWLLAPRAERRVASAVTTTKPAASVSDATTAGFAREMLARSAATPDAAVYHLRWDSPVKMPHLEKRP